MGREEQVEEREVLDSIFPEEITDISDTSYQVLITLDVELPTEDDEPPIHPAITLTVTYPPNYPDEVPILEVNHPKDAPKFDHLSFPEDGPGLIATLDETIQDSLGAAMIFTLISTIKDSAESLIASRVAAVQAEIDKAAVQAEEKENAKFHGEAVTRESFLAWRKNFIEEQRKREEEQEKKAEESMTRGRKLVKEEKKITGRELWERGLVGKIDEEGDEDGEGEKDALAGVERLAVHD